MSKRRKLDAIMNELKKIKYDLKKIQDEYRLVTSKQTEGDLHPPAECSQHNCPVKGVENRICTMKQQFNEVESEIESLEHMIESDNAENSDEAFFDIENLPEELIMQIFKYLSLDDLCRAGRVCKKFHAVARSPVFWKKVTVKSKAEAVLGLLDTIPQCVTHLKLDFHPYRINKRTFNLEEFLIKLGKACPFLEVLIFIDALLCSYNSHSVLHLCESFLPNVRVLILKDCTLMSKLKFENNDCVTSRVQIIHAVGCRIDSYNSLEYSPKTIFYKFPYLKKLRLTRTFIFGHQFLSEPFGISHLELLDLEFTGFDLNFLKLLQTYGTNLKELYLGFNEQLTDHDINFETGAFPCLEVICLNSCSVSDAGIDLLITSCPTLKTVIIGHSFAANSICNSDKIQCLDESEKCNHYANLNYMHM